MQISYFLQILMLNWNF